MTRSTYYGGHRKRPTRDLTTGDIQRSGELLDCVIRLHENPVDFGTAIGHNGVLSTDPLTGKVTRRKQYASLHREIVAHALSSNRTSCIVSRNHGKTTIFQDIVLWLKWRDMEKRIMYMSAATGLANQVLGEIRGHIDPQNVLTLANGVELTMGSALPELRPVRPPSGSAPGAFSLAGRQGSGREPCFYPSSIGSNKAGQHPTDIVADDPANERNSTTPVQREKVIHSFKQLEPILRDPSGGIYHVGTPWAFYDISAWIGEHAQWSQYRFGCWDGVNPSTGVADGTGPGPDGAWPLCPNYYTAEELLEEEQRVDDPEFWSQQYLVRPIAASYAMFTDDRIHRASVTATHKDLPPGQQIFLWDPTSRADAQAGDWNGLITVHVTTAKQCKGHPGIAHPKLGEMADNTCIYFPVFASEIRGQLAECMSTLEKQVYEQPNMRAVWVENTGAVGGIKGWMNEKHWTREKNLTFFPVKNATNANKPQRLQGIQLALEEGRILFPSDFPGRDILLKRLVEFPKSESDDLPDALALLSNYAMKRAQPPGLVAPPQPRPGPESVHWRPPRPKRRR